MQSFDILYSIKVNCIKQHRNSLWNFILIKIGTYNNIIYNKKKLKNIISQYYSISGLNFNKSISGLYKSDSGIIYSEKIKSITVITKDITVAISLAKDIKDEFKQETVLVIDKETSKVFSVK